jgi:hypothetical protein
MGWLDAIGGLFGGGNSSSGWGNIFSSILSGWAAGEESEDQLEALKEGARIKGEEERETLAFADKLAYYRNQQRRHETSRALDSAYNQFSTVRDFAPNYVRGTGLDAMPEYPTIVRNDDDDEEDDD